MPKYEVRIVAHHSIVVEAPTPEDASQIAASADHDYGDFSYVDENDNVEELTEEHAEGLSFFRYNDELQVVKVIPEDGGPF